MNTYSTSAEIGRSALEALEAEGAGRQRLKLVNPLRWTHTLVVTGELNRRSATTLEEEIECLCEEGVAALKIDLRQVASIDSLGVSVISYRSQECRRRGCTLAVIPGSTSVRRALEEAGVPIVAPEFAAFGPDPSLMAPAAAQDAAIGTPIETQLALGLGGNSPEAVEEGGSERVASLPTRVGSLTRWVTGH
jgi:anti-anti-sigma factor